MLPSDMDMNLLVKILKKNTLTVRFFSERSLIQWKCFHMRVAEIDVLYPRMEKNVLDMSHTMLHYLAEATCNYK